MTDEKYLLAYESLTAHQWRGLKDLTSALSDMEPLAKRRNLGKVVADQLVDFGLAERGPCIERYAAIGYEIGYRVSDVGWKVLDRGRWPKRQPARE